ncbi:MAG: chromosome segregation protein SMC [Pseudomonadota bacterium]
MQFTKIRLNGFKSFVDPTEMIIADGLTGIVGPNGCGKSNLLEALRWVMGENRAKAMRGDGMEDVIFAGTSRRPPRNFAEVSVMIDNSDRLAPVGFNDSDMIEIARRITRDAGSAYKLNQKDLRARDVQMLFADASTGAHSPALVRQGQISELINAKPKARRRILEEAAGISGLYQRRHEAELKLKGAETNLARVDDVIEHLAQQLQQLARQARQAARYRAISDELRRSEGVLLYRRWREADEARIAADDDLKQRMLAASEAERGAVEAAKAREQAEEKMPPLREEAAIASALVQRLSVERERLAEEEVRAAGAIETLTARLAQLGHDIERETALNSDAGETIARLSAEADELAKADEGHAETLDAAASLAREAADILQEREAEFARRTEDVARLSARHQSAQRLLEDASRTVERSEAEVSRAKEAADSAQTAEGQAGEALQTATTTLTEAQAAADKAEAALQGADEARTAAQAREAEARGAKSEADGEVSALKAEVAALAKLVDRESSEGGQVLDLLNVESGFEKALGAALADDLRAPAIANDGATGWANLPDYDSAQSLPNGVNALTAHMNVPSLLVRRMSQVGVVAREDGPRLQADLLPGQRLVSVEGDLWRWDGYRTAADDAPSAAALRLQQLNRLQALKQDLEEANARAAGAAQAHETLKATLDEVTQADAAARETRRTADARLAEASRAVSKAEAEASIAAGKVESQRDAMRRHADEATAARARMREAEQALEGLGDLDAEREEVEEYRMAAEAARMTMMTRRSEHDEVRRAGEDRRKRQEAIAKDLSTWERRAQTAGTRMAELHKRTEETEVELKDARLAPEQLQETQHKLTADIEVAEKRKAEADDALSVAEGQIRQAVDAERQAERAASEAREARAASEARAESIRATVEAAAQRIQDDLDDTPEALLEKLGSDPDEMPAADKVEAEVARLKLQRDALGAVNLRAEEDAREVEEEHTTLTTEKADLEAAIRTLRNGIAGLNKEGRERLLTAFEQVNSNFAMLFTHLFGGGEAKLVMVESDDPLDAGLEIMCQPPGKKLSTLSLLSGGEQTLTALALIFAVFLANPAPICVLDEVDAPLDDANVNRFCDLLDEMTRRTDTRFLIITHHAVTMARMDRLFGVTMGEQGVSQLVSVDLRKAEAMVA